MNEIACNWLLVGLFVQQRRIIIIMEVSKIPTRERLMQSQCLPLVELELKLGLETQQELEPEPRPPRPA